MGLSAERQFQAYHRVLNRAAWSSWALSRTLLAPLVQTCVATGPISCALDTTLEQMAANPKTRCQRVTIRQRYGEGRRQIEIVS
jgi:hypothetical protein